MGFVNIEGGWGWSKKGGIISLFFSLQNLVCISGETPEGAFHKYHCFSLAIYRILLSKLLGFVGGGVTKKGDRSRTKRAKNTV